MKLGVSYILFDGVELLESSIRQIREHVDHITVIHQKTSWFGNSASSTILPELARLVNLKLVDQIIEFKNFTPKYSKTRNDILAVKDFERTKRQVGLDNALAHGCTHYLCMDIDEFYKTSEFKAAKDLIIQEGYTATAASFINYVNVPTIHRGYDPNRVPFICKIEEGSKMTKFFFVRCDPTRGILNGLTKTIDFDPNIITMHHMETVRKDLTLKYQSTTRGIFDRDRTPELVERIKRVSKNTQVFDFNKIIFPGVTESRLTHCENIFNIPYESWK
jgi:hypothetical protein